MKTRFIRYGASLIILLGGLTWYWISKSTRTSEYPTNQSGKANRSEQTIKTVMLFPLGDKIPSKLVKSTYEELKRILPQLRLRESIALPRMAFYPARNRYRADSLLAWMSRMAKPNEVFIGITDVDISTTKDGHPDWGVMGLAYSPGSAAVASSFRLKNKSALWKVAIHELGHTTSLPHCPVKTCFMRDAEGGNPTDQENEFCTKCKSVLVQNGWRL